jgi:hypothetical protein
LRLFHLARSSEAGGLRSRCDRYRQRARLQPPAVSRQSISAAASRNRDASAQVWQRASLSTLRERSPAGVPSIVAHSAAASSRSA